MAHLMQKYISSMTHHINPGRIRVMNEIIRTYILSVEMHLPTQDTLAIIKKIVGAYKEVPFYIQPFSGNA